MDKMWCVEAVAALVLVATACSPSESTPHPMATPTPTIFVARPLATPTDIWLDLLKKVPHPYTTPLPAQTPTILDGIYAKIEPTMGTPVACRRCPDYLPEGGIWKLNLDKGVYRIFHAATGWRSLGSFTLSDNQLFLFNDPACFDKIGRYKWQLEDGQLTLVILEDTCHVNRRARSFANMPWIPCQPPSEEAAVTNHWPIPPGCNSQP